jgi:hypothetical protein
MRGRGEVDSRPILSELLPTGGGTMDMRRHQSALVRDELKMLVPVTGATQFFDLRSDPLEQAPNLPAVSERAAPLVETMRATAHDLRARAAPAAPTAQLDEDTTEKLRALGYQF